VATVTVTGELDITTATALTRRLLQVGAALPTRTAGVRALRRFQSRSHSVRAGLPT